MAWIVTHGGEPEVRAAKKSSSGLHGSRFQDSTSTEARPPSRFVLPAGALR
jgi:hypothetical protein